jgi:glycosyltransferase involved in cell wall biosynthesis
MGELRVAIDALGLPPVGGAKASALGWLAALGRYHPENHYLVFLSRPEESLLSYPSIEQRAVSIENRFAVRTWAQLVLPRLLARERVDLLHSMKNLTASWVPCPTIVTVNDLSHVVLRDLYPRIDGLYWQVVQPWALRRAARIIAISRSTKSDLVHYYGLEENRVVTIYPSCDSRFHEPCDSNDLEKVRAKYGLPKSILLYVGGLGVHKNVVSLVRAFAQIADQIPHGLVLVGGAFHTSSDRDLAREVAALGLEDRVWMLGPVSAEDLPLIYRLADLFLLASLNEGFGLVLLEAMACGTPVLAARRGSIPEVADEAAWLVDDPLDIERLAAAIVTLLSDRETLAELSRRGLKRSRVFTWERAADRTVALYGEVADERE